MEKPRLLLDENIGKKTAEVLRENGYDVRSVFEDMRGVSDVDILDTAMREKRIVVTLDKDFGMLVFRDSKKHLGVLFLRLQKESAENITQAILSTLSEYGDMVKGKFVTVSEYDVRMR